MATRFQRVAGDKNAKVADLVKVISMDPLLAVRLLKLANSPYYGLCKEVETVLRAVSVLGVKTTRDLAIAMYIGTRAEEAGTEATHCWS